MIIIRNNRFCLIVVCAWSWIALSCRIARSRRPLVNFGRHIKNIPYLQNINDDDHKTISAAKDVSNGKQITTSLWPPWPINVLKERRHKGNDPPSTSTETSERENVNVKFPSMAALFFAYGKQNLSIISRQVREVGSQIWFNLPPAVPPVLLLSSIPRTGLKIWEGKAPATAVDAVLSSKSTLQRIPLFSSEPVRTFVLFGLGMSILSWSNQELQRKRKLTPLPLPSMNTNNNVVSKIFLPPFLPQDIIEPEMDTLLNINATVTHGVGNDNDDQSALLRRVSPKIRKYLSDTNTPKRILQYKYNDLLRGRAFRKREVAKIRRNLVFDELVALQTLKNRRYASSKKKNKGIPNAAASDGTTTPTETKEMGFALVTGASRGIGRAIAVELARWEIPLVLVARDAQKLAKVAHDIEICYGVKCCVLQADLSKVDAAERIHQATTEAGIPVDILINNAGIASEGLAVDTATSDIEQKIILNSITFAKLSKLYGHDMKKKRRGRILMVSSMAGLCAASPNTAIYGACKAFGKSLSLSMAREMEIYGVGVTCLIPGPVRGTDFRSASGTEKALCWYLPFYSRSPQVVAHQGVISLLDGDTQTIPGWQNRVFANIIRPIIPQRIEVMMVQLAFGPFRLPSFLSSLRRDTEGVDTNKEESSSSYSQSSSSWVSPLPSQLQSRYKTNPPPRFLKLAESNTETRGQLKCDANQDLSTPTKIYKEGPIVVDNESNSPEGQFDRANTTCTQRTNDRVGSRDSADGSDADNKTIHLQQSETHSYNQNDEKEELRQDDTYNTKQNKSYINGKPEIDKKLMTRDDESFQEKIKVGRDTINTKDNVVERTKLSPWFDDDVEDKFSPRLGPLNIM